jgi:transcriptional regulator with XRE-family HTH domain
MGHRISKDHNKKQPNRIDVIAGRNLMLARQRAGLTQQRLGKAVGLTFQQIQKYERGTNRITLARAWQFAAILGIGIADFFEHPPASAGGFDSAGYSRWSALYQRAQAAGIASEVTRITRAIIDLRGFSEISNKKYGGQ